MQLSELYVIIKRRYALERVGNEVFASEEEAKTAIFMMPSRRPDRQDMEPMRLDVYIEQEKVRMVGVVRNHERAVRAADDAERAC